MMGIDDTQKYRYSLSRVMKSDGPKVTFILLNPSTADAYEDDATVRRCKGFALSWGCARFEIVNLFAYRATNPSELSTAENPVGDRNNEFIRKAVQDSHMVIAAWGNEHGVVLDRNKEVLKLLGESHRVLCFGQTKSKNPKHPLYLAKDAPLFPMKW